MLRARGDAEALYFVAKRSERGHLGGVWGVPGGALNEDESPLDGALRELAEETGLFVDAYEIAAAYHHDHDVWSYWTSVLDVSAPLFDPPILNWETDEIRRVTVAELAYLDLLPAFRETLRELAILS